MTNNTQKSTTECREALCTLCGSETLPCKCKYLANVPHRAMVTIPKFEYAKLVGANADTIRLVEALTKISVKRIQHWGDHDGNDKPYWKTVPTEAAQIALDALSQHTGGKACV